MPATERGRGTGKLVEKKLTFEKNLLSAIYFPNSQNASSSNYRNQTKINELKIPPCYECELMKPSKRIINLANLRTMFGYLFKESEFTANAESSMQVSPCTTAMQKFHTSYMHSSFFCHLLICPTSINASNCSKYCNSITDYNEIIAIH